MVPRPVKKAKDKPQDAYPRILQIRSFMKTEIIVNIMLPYAFPGILSVILLAFSRALGETMIVLMLAVDFSSEAGSTSIIIKKLQKTIQT